LKQDYPKILKAGGELVVICPDSREEHRKYATTLFGEELPYFYVSDADLHIARRYSFLRKEEHPHGGFYHRSLWILNREAIITHRSVPWKGNIEIQEYQRLFDLVGSEPGQWRATCGLRKAESGEYVPIDPLS
jgi:peroxiredoxin